MTIVAKLYYLRIAPRKVRLVADLIRGKSVEDAQTILNFTVKKAAHPFLKLLKSAIANAKNNFQIKESDLYISRITVDEGPKNKRWRARARGRAFEIQKKTSHIILYLDKLSKKEPHSLARQAVVSSKKIQKQKTIKTSALPQKNIEKMTTQEDKKEEVKTSETIPTAAPKVKKHKFRPWFKLSKPRIEKGIKKIFRRKSF